LSSNIISPHKK